MKDLVDPLTLHAIQHHDDGASAEYYRRLKETRRLWTTRCAACAKLCYPPRPFCPHCFAERQQWVEIGEGATLYAFTTQARALRFVAPDVIGVVEVPGVGRIVSKIEARLEELRIGMPMRFVVLEISPDLVVHAFRPR
jgi:hypothetical protein